MSEYRQYRHSEVIGLSNKYIEGGMTRDTKNFRSWQKINKGNIGVLDRVYREVKKFDYYFFFWLFSRHLYDIRINVFTDMNPPFMST